jgi:hypothetical protein
MPPPAATAAAAATIVIKSMNTKVINTANN